MTKEQIIKRFKYISSKWSAAFPDQKWPEKSVYDDIKVYAAKFNLDTPENEHYTMNNRGNLLWMNALKPSVFFIIDSETGDLVLYGKGGVDNIVEEQFNGKTVTMVYLWLPVNKGEEPNYAFMYDKETRSINFAPHNFNLLKREGRLYVLTCEGGNYYLNPDFSYFIEGLHFPDVVRGTTTLVPCENVSKGVYDLLYTQYGTPSPLSSHDTTKKFYKIDPVKKYCCCIVKTLCRI